MKILLLQLLLVLLAARTWAQSTFAFYNRSANGAIDAPIFDAQGTPLAGTNYLAELYGGTTADSLTPTTDFSFLRRVMVPFRTDANAGYLVPNTGSMTVWNASPGGYAWLQVRAWDARLGATYEEVIALGIGGYGESPLFLADGADPTIFQAPAPPYGIQSFNLRPVVPEPSALALLGLGIFARCWRVRSKVG